MLSAHESYCARSRHRMYYTGPLDLLSCLSRPLYSIKSIRCTHSSKLASRRLYIPNFQVTSYPRRPLRDVCVYAQLCLDLSRMQVPRPTDHHNTGSASSRDPSFENPASFHAETHPFWRVIHGSGQQWMKAECVPYSFMCVSTSLGQLTERKSNFGRDDAAESRFPTLTGCIPSSLYLQEVVGAACRLSLET